MTSFDPIRIGLFTELFASIAEEMGVVLERVSHSPNIKERRDHSCAVFDTQGRLIAQAAHIPVHLGAMEFLMQKWLAEGPRIRPGAFYITNDPFFAGTHLPDISILQSVELVGKTVGYVATRAHHSDVGGSKPGSLAPVDSIEKEGLIISPSEMSQEIVDRLLSGSRNPSERRGDLSAQMAACNVGSRRYASLAEKFGIELEAKFEECLEYASQTTSAAIRSIPEGVYTATDFLDCMPGDNPLARISVSISVRDGRMSFDFEGTDDQRPIGLNATEAVTRSACYYVVRCLAPEAPTNGGCWGPIEVKAPKGTLVNATYPAPVVAGNTETSQRIVDTIFQALSEAMPQRIPACSQGTMNSIAFGKGGWAYYETIGGGAGGGPIRRGASGIHSHMTNTRNTPIEALEIELPVRVTKYALRRGSGGSGKHPGGDGVIREFELLEDSVDITLMADRYSLGPPGILGGECGKHGRCEIRMNGEWIEMPSKFSIRLNGGDLVRIETPGGGGYGV
jgi:N-methylhydantoinase B